MPNTILVGAQWGDEGKGKIIDYLTDSAEVVVRCQGGNNAGHTVIVGGEKFVLHLLPSGVLWPDKTCVIGNGVVINPVDLVREINDLMDRGVDVRGKLFISDCAHLVLPYHRELDVLRERLKGRKKIGTTKRGIGPCYGDKVERVGLRAGEMLDIEQFEARLREKVASNNRLLRALGSASIRYGAVREAYLRAAEFLAPFITNTVVYLHRAVLEKKSILFEGAQGTFLDIDHGTYPYVTSSNTTAGGAITGTGVPPNRVDRVIGVMKAYTTRVGEGPLPTECSVLSRHFHDLGREFGATTGRPRRCGWFDAVATRYACIVNGFDDLAVTNLDGLDKLERIRVCVSYGLGGKTLDVPPTQVDLLAQCEPVYVEMPGWQADTSGVRKFGDLPKGARQYLEKICELTGARLSVVSVGAGREQTILC